MLTIDERKLLDCLPKGSERPLTSGELKRLMGFDRRKVCDLVESLRIKGYAIGAIRGTNGGVLSHYERSRPQKYGKCDGGTSEANA